MRVVVASESAELGRRVRQAALNAGLSCSSGDCVEPLDLPARLARSKPDLVLLAVGPGAERQAVDVARLCTQAPVLVVGDERHHAGVVAALRQGARGFVDADHLQEDLQNAVGSLRGERSAEQRKGGAAWGVVGAAPGVGATSVALNLAFEIAHRYPRKVCFAEFADGLPAASLMLDMPQGSHALQALDVELDRLDQTLVKQAVSHHRLGADLLLQEPFAARREPLGGETLRRLAAILRLAYPMTVLDFGWRLDAGRGRALEMADDLLLVTRLDVPSLRAARDRMQQLQELGVPGDKLLIVANRYGEGGQIPWRKAAKYLGRPITAYIPSAPRLLNAAVNDGLPAVAALGAWRFRKRIAALAATLKQRSAGLEPAMAEAHA